MISTLYLLNKLNISILVGIGINRARFTVSCLCRGDICSNRVHYLTFMKLVMNLFLKNAGSIRWVVINFSTRLPSFGQWIREWDKSRAHVCSIFRLKNIFKIPTRTKTLVYSTGSTQVVNY